MAAKSTKKATGKKRSFHQELVLNRWVLGFFHGGTLAALKMRLGDDRFEGIDEDGQTRFFHELTRGLFDPNKLPEAELRRYDLNIVAHWQAITAHRNKLEGHELQMKYFQYLSLLFTELYLDWYFNRRQDLLDGLNEEMTRYRAETCAEPFRDFEADDLNKIAFWNATGSGKTLLLHVNIRQYLHDILNRIYRTRLKGNSTNCTLLTKCPNIRFPTKRPVKVQVVPSAKSVDSNPILQIAD